MSSTTTPVSLCVIRIEVNDLETKQNSDTSVVKKVRGCREAGDILIESYFSDPSELHTLLKPSNNAKPGKKLSESKDTKESKQSDKGDQSTDSVDPINHFPSKPYVETTKGIFHLFKEDKLMEMHRAAERSHTICILSVPISMTYQELLSFTAAFHREIQHFRILKDNNPNQYLTLITFRTSSAASSFYETFNGVTYDLVESDWACHLVFVSEIEIVDNGLSLSEHTELPLCPVCLERMDESVDGILTILSNHSFQSSLHYSYIENITCLVCRCIQLKDATDEKHCMECGAGSNNEDLWICLICGHLGCSRYHRGHAFEHYHETHHCYALQLGNNRVWDYVRDNFVHRLLQNKDGKLVDSGQESAKSEGAAVDEKIDSVQLEFTSLLTSQLETQRKYFEEKYNRLEEIAEKETSELRSKIDEIASDTAKTQETCNQISKEKHQLEKKLNAVNNKMSLAETELVEERELRKALSLNQTFWEQKYAKSEKEFEELKIAMEAETKELEDQVRDLMFSLEAQKQIDSLADKEEVASGRIVVGPKPNTGSTKKHKPKR